MTCNICLDENINTYKCKSCSFHTCMKCIINMLKHNEHPTCPQCKKDMCILDGELDVDITLKNTVCINCPFTLEKLTINCDKDYYFNSSTIKRHYDQICRTVLKQCALPLSEKTIMLDNLKNLDNIGEIQCCNRMYNSTKTILEYLYVFNINYEYIDDSIGEYVKTCLINEIILKLNFNIQSQQFTKFNLDKKLHREYRCILCNDKGYTNAIHKHFKSKSHVEQLEHFENNNLENERLKKLNEIEQKLLNIINSD